MREIISPLHIAWGFSNYANLNTFGMSADGRFRFVWLGVN